jgi:hypothetical protein
MILRRCARLSAGAAPFRRRQLDNVEIKVKNAAERYLDCIAHCARGLRCRHAASGATRRGCALLCATDDGRRHPRPRRRRIWPAILLQKGHHAHR